MRRMLPGALKRRMFLYDGISKKRNRISIIPIAKNDIGGVKQQKAYFPGSFILLLFHNPPKGDRGGVVPGFQKIGIRRDSPGLIQKEEKWRFLAPPGKFSIANAVLRHFAIRLPWVCM